MTPEITPSEENPIPAPFLEAIDAKRKVRLSYERDGSAEGPRTVLPHAVYRGGEGSLLLFAFQTDGASSRGKLPAWRRFFLDSVTDAEQLEEEFEVNEEYDTSARDFAAGLLASVY